MRRTTKPQRRGRAGGAPDQITRANVSTLQQVWSSHVKPAGYTGRMREDDAIRLIIGNMMYLASPYGAIHALDATTGVEKWKLPVS